MLFYVKAVSFSVFFVFVKGPGGRPRGDWRIKARRKAEEEALVEADRMSRAAGVEGLPEGVVDSEEDEI